MQIAIPIIWRYLFRQYIKVLVLSTTAFIVILMTIRLNDIAHFASFGANSLAVLRFAINQMAYVIPYSLPISCFISSIILVQRLSLTHELTAMRSCGLAFKDIFTPILLTAGFISLINFVLISESATGASLSNQKLKEKLRTVNPLVLLHNKHLMKLRGIYFDTLGPSKVGEYATDAILAMSNKKNDHLHLMLAKSISCHEDRLVGEQMTLITNLGGGKESTFDKMLVENIAKTSTQSSNFTELLNDNVGVQAMRSEQLQLNHLLSYMKSQKKALKNTTDKRESHKIKRSISRCYSDLIRRLSTGISVMTFTFMGLAFGISISRHHTNRSLMVALSLAALYLMANLVAKEVRDSLWLSGFFYLSPHLLILLLSIWTMRRMTRGLEG